ncbi:class I SAM-dependent methyltransferase family protein [Candidatus Woesearchaeota archaeon]|nr:class I SAM-dependent methyltransferase family protein [Candidatus Woesearchaeota archaeon]
MGAVGKIDERRSFDVVGSIAIIEVPRGSGRKEKAVAEGILSMHSNIRTVVKKVGAHEGAFRIQKSKFIAGEKTKETVHRESGVLLKLDINRVYFSPRLSGERLRIASLVKRGERVLVMFSGCGPYPLVISRNSLAKEVVGIELNRKAHEYAEFNVKLNKLKNIILLNGDVRTEVKRLKGKFDRVVMPLPKGGELYLKESFSRVKKGGTIHFYVFLQEERIPEGGLELVSQELKPGKFRISRVVKCGQVAPRCYRVCFDIKIL